MEKKTIKANEGNDIKFRDGVENLYNPDQNNQPITEDAQNNEKIEYFTE